MNRLRALSYDTEHVAKPTDCGYCLTIYFQEYAFGVSSGHPLGAQEIIFR